MLKTRYPGVLAKARGLGLLLGMEFPTDGIGYKVASGLFSRGVLTAGTLTNAKNIRFEPALNIPQETLDEVLNRLEDVFKSIDRPQRKQVSNLYAGRMLRVDLSAGKVTTEPFNDQWAKKYIGGWGLGAKYYTESVDPKVDPLSSDNTIVVMTGPMAGTLAPTASRTCVVSKSPHTGTIFESNIGGAFGPELKFAGYDGIVISGKADKPVWLRIEDDASPSRMRISCGARASLKPKRPWRRKWATA